MDITNKLFGGVERPLLSRDVDSPGMIIETYMAKASAPGTQMRTQRLLKEIMPVPVMEAEAGKCAHFASKVSNASDATMNPTVLWAIAKPIRPY